MPLKAILLILLAAAFAGISGFTMSNWLHGKRSADTLVVGSARLDFELPDLTGRLSRLSEHDGRVIVLNFWATWCPPCREEIPMLNRFQTDFADAGVQIVGVALDDANKVRRFASKTALAYPTLLGEMATLNIGRIYGNSRGVLPYSVVIDRSGKIVSTHLGQLDREQLEAAVRPHL